jgi:hypothetical protein
MLKRIEFSLNLDDPQEAHIYHALLPSLRYRRGGAVIRQALETFLANQDKPQLTQTSRVSRIPVQECVDEQGQSFEFQTDPRQRRHAWAGHWLRGCQSAHR